jgi:membrane protease subunit (stomatin/prohibitin family)
VPVEAIENFDEEQAINIISNTFHREAFIGNHGTFNINPIEEWIKALEEIKMLHEENKKLYERLLEAEKNRK